MAFTPQQHREYREKLKAEGICITCHKEPAREWSVVCQSCQDKSYKAKSELRKSGGRCHDCCNILDDFSIAVGRSDCPTCHEKRAVQQRRRSEKERC